MPRFLYAIGLAALIAGSPGALGQPGEICRVALTEQAYDREHSSIRSNLMLSTRDQLCSSEYSNIGEAQASARNRGFNLGYGGLSIGSSGSRQSNNGKWNISETTFCRASASDLKAAYAADYDRQIASIAVAAWLECVKSSRENLLYLEYTMSKDGQQFTGTLHTTASTGRLARQIVGIPAVGGAAKTVRCNIAGKEYQPNSGITSPIEVLTTGTAIACEKSGNEGASIALQTSEGSTPFIKLPSAADKKAYEFETLRSMIDAVKDVDILAIQDRIKALDLSVSKLQPVRLYQCPTTNEGKSQGAWATFGCVGQISNSPKCRNFTWLGSSQDGWTTHDCEPITLYRPTP